MLKISKKDVAILLLLTALGASLRLYGLDFKCLEGDEYFTILEARTLGSNLQSLLYFISLYFWMKAGESDFWLRLLSVVWNLFWIPAMFWLGKKARSRETGLVMAAFAAFSAFAAGYSQQLRFYTFFLLTATLSYGAFFSYLRTSGGSRALLLGTGFVTILSHFFGFLAVLPQATYLFFQKLEARKRITTAITLAILMATGITVLMNPSFQESAWQVLQRFANGKGEYAGARGIGIASLAKIPMTFYFFSLGQFVYPLDWQLSVPGLFLFTLLFLKGMLSLRGTRAFIFLIITFAAGLGAVFIVFESAAPVNTGTSVRYVIFLLPLFYLAVAEGVLSLGRSRNAAAFALLVLAAASFFNLWHGEWSYGGGPQINWRDIGARLKVDSFSSLVLHDGRTGGAAGRYFPKEIKQDNIWKYRETAVPSAEKIFFLSGAWRKGQREESERFLHRLYNEGYAVVRGQVAYPVFFYELKKTDVPGMPFSIYGLEFQDLKLPLKVQYENFKTEVNGMFSLQKGEEADFRLPGIGRRLIVFSNLTGNALADGTPVLEIIVTDKSGNKRNFNLRKGAETGMWDADAIMNGTEAASWRKKAALSGLSMYRGSLRDFKARIFGAAFDLEGLEPSSIFVKALSDMEVHVWGIYPS